MALNGHGMIYRVDIEPAELNVFIEFNCTIVGRTLKAKHFAMRSKAIKNMFNSILRSEKSRRWRSLILLSIAFAAF